jgi:hypothetical protein
LNVLTVYSMKKYSLFNKLRAKMLEFVPMRHSGDTDLTRIGDIVDVNSLQQF